ncbi:MAG TPA: glycosyltransferase family 61 protein [Acetobacteraceae bacterium]|nr:glycosyltransferase family 61 protein [Acetobacteraceae bacterium]
MAAYADDRAQGPVFHIEPKGRLGNQMMQYMVALKFRSLVPGTRFSNVSFPGWGIHHPQLPLSGRLERAERQQHFEMDGLAARARAGTTKVIIYNGFGQRMENFLDASFYREVFRSTLANPYLFDKQYVVCPVRAEDVLDGRAGHHYPLTPVEFYADIVAGTGLKPVFMGQTAPNDYTNRLRERFPNALFLQTGNPMLDFEIIRQAKNIVLGVTTFGWLAAWFSHADHIFMAVSGMFNPMQYPPVDLLPFGDPRYRFYLFPINYGVPLSCHAEAHRRIAPYWRFVPHQELQRMFREAPRFDPSFAQMRQALNAEYYLRMNADVRVYFDNDPEAAWVHYYNNGVREGRHPFRFAPAWYAWRYPKAAFEVAQGDYGTLSHHYVAVGRAHGYRPVPDDTGYVGAEQLDAPPPSIRMLAKEVMRLDPIAPSGVRGSVTLGASLERYLSPPAIAAFHRAPDDSFCIYRLRDVTLDASIMGLSQGRKPIPETLFLVNQDDYEFALVKAVHPELTDPRRHYIVGCNRAYDNYFHWITQALPAIDWGMRLRRDQDATLALPVLELPWQEASLALLGYADAPRLTLHSTTHYWLSRAEYADFLGSRMAWSVPTSAAATYARLRQAVAPADDGDDAIYIARTDSMRRRMVNEDALIAMLQRQRVKIVVPGNLPVAQQFALFRRARLVIGPHGAGLSNIAACEPGTHVYELLSKDYPNYCYCQIAQVCALHYRCDVFPNEPDDAAAQDRKWRVDVDAVAWALDDIRAHMAAAGSTV